MKLLNNYYTYGDGDDGDEIYEVYVEMFEFQNPQNV